MTPAERKALEDLIALIRLKTQHVKAVRELIESLEAGTDKQATRYDWSKAPEWAMWCATDEQGDQYWYEAKPGKSQNAPLWDQSPGAVDAANDMEDNVYCQDWRESLEARPS